MDLSTTTNSLLATITTHPTPDAIPSAERADFYSDLTRAIRQHNQKYFQEKSPLITDTEFDQLFNFLKKFEETFPDLADPESPTQQLQSDADENFTKRAHPTPLLSLQNSYSADDLAARHDFVSRSCARHEITQRSYTLEPKFDGISVELQFDDGQLQRAITRGDGHTGDDITTNVKTIKNLPHKIPHTDPLRVRAEILLPKSARKNLNESREKSGLPPFANTRNAAAGSIKLLDTREVARRELQIFCYEILQNSVTQTQKEIFQKFSERGLPIFDRLEHHSDISQIQKICSDPTTKTFFENQNLDFDGLVLKINEIEIQNKLGSTDHHPRRAIAFKFPAQLARTELLGVDRQIGRSGVITPVAQLAPVQLGGVTIRKASLHNLDFITDKNIHLHDQLRLQRSGEVIPYIVGRISPEKNPDKISEKNPEKKLQKIAPPPRCPSCAHPTTKISMQLHCTNTACPAQITEKLQHFVSKNALNIDGLGPAILEILQSQNLVTAPDQIFQLHKHERTLRTLPGFADRKISELFREIEESKTREFRRLLHGLSIPHIGKKIAKLLENFLTELITDPQNLRKKLTPATDFASDELETPAGTNSGPPQTLDENLDENLNKNFEKNSTEIPDPQKSGPQQNPWENSPENSKKNSDENLEGKTGKNSEKKSDKNFDENSSKLSWEKAEFPWENTEKTLDEIPQNPENSEKNSDENSDKKSRKRSPPKIREKFLTQLALHETSDQNPQEISPDFLIQVFTAPDPARSLLPGVGPKLIAALHARFSDPTNQKILKNLHQNGVAFSLSETSESSGPHFCITGTFPVPRPRIIETAEKNWRIFDPAPTATTQILLLGQNPGSKKNLARSKNPNIEIVDDRATIKNKFPFFARLDSETPGRNWPNQASLF